MENGILTSVNDICFSTDNDSMQSVDRIQLVEINNSVESRTDQVSVTDINAFCPVNEVPSSLSASQVDAIAKTVCKDYNVCEGKTFIVPDSSQTSLCTTIKNLNNLSDADKLDKGIGEDSDTQSDVLNTVSGCTEKVIVKTSTPCKLHTVEQISSKSVTCEGKPFSGDSDKFSETTYSDTLSMNTSGDVFPITKDTEIVGSDVIESKRCGAQNVQFITDNLQNEIPVLAIQDVCSESEIVINNNSDTVCAAEKYKKDSKLKKASNSKCIDETVMPVKDNQSQQILSKSSVPARKSLNNVSRTVLYQCTYCSYTVKQLEKLSSHVLTCAEKHKQEQNQESYLSEAPPLLNDLCGEKPFLEGNNQLSEIVSTDPLNMNTSSDGLPGKKETKIMGSDGKCEINYVIESNRCGAQNVQFITDNLQNEIPVLSIQDLSSESDIIVVNNSGTISADEKYKKDSELKKATNSKCIDETVVSVKDNQNQQILNKSSVPARKSLNDVSGSALYQCTYCSFTHKQLEELSTHVLTCAVKRKQEQNQESYLNEAPPLLNDLCGGKAFLEGNNQLSETVSTDPLSMNTSSDGLPSKKETEIMSSNGKREVSYVIESKRYGAQNVQFITDNLQNEIPVLSIQDVCSESDIIVINNNSDIISPEEKDKKASKLKKANDSKCVDETVMSVKDYQNQQNLSKSSVPARKSLHNVSGSTLYQCIYCSFTDKQIEKCSSHVLTCAKKRRQELNQESYLDGEPSSKTRVLEDQRLVLSNTELTTASKTQSIVLSHTQVPVTPKNQLIITPQTQLLTSSQVRIATTPKTQVNSLKPTQFVVSSPTQPKGTNKTVFTVSPKLVSATTNDVINPQNQYPISTQPRVSVSSQNLILKPQISVSSQSQSSSMRVQPVITLQTQLPIVSTAQLSSASKPQIVTPSQIPFASATKVTLGPHSQVPIIPQAPLTLPQQGLTIAQAGTQLLITTKPVQQSAGNSNQPTLLGLGIGTNPAVVPNNIVLLPNVVLNSVSPCGKVNGKQAPAVQRQLILQTTANTPSSVTPIHLQKSSVNIPQSTKSRVFMAPLLTLGSSPVSTSGVKTTVSNTVQKSKLSLSSSTSNCTPATTTNTALASITNVKPELSKQMNMSLDKFICEICDDSVKDLGKLRSHMKCLHEINIHPKVMPSFNCQKCQFCFFTEQGLERHLVGSHGLVTTGMQEAADKGKDGGRCPICGWGYQNKLLHHVATDHKVCLKPADLTYKCTLCTASFGVYKRFEEHVYSVHRPAISKLAQGSSESSSPAVK